jgi:YD repeat-containing protein
VQYNITTGDTTTEKYIYDANKLLVQYKEYDVINKRSELTSTTSYQYDANRNITKETTGSSQISYEYYPNFVNTLNLGDVYFSRNSNLTKTTTYSGSFSQTLNHTYTFDTMNRITSEKITVSSGEVVIRSYTY